MILLHHIVHIATRPSLAVVRQNVLVLQIAYAAYVGRILVDVDDPSYGDVWPAQRFAEKTFRSLGTSGLVQEKINRLPNQIHGSIEIHPLASNLDVGLVNTPGIVRLLEKWTSALVDFWRILLNPAKDRGMVN